MQPTEITLHGTALSGHSHRIELLLRALDLPYRFEHTPAEIRRAEAYRKLNPLQQIPVLQDGEMTLADSNAIMVYLVKRYAPESVWLPDDPVGAAAVQRWLSIAAGEVMHGPSIARLVVQFGLNDDRARAERIAKRLLTFMQEHLAQQNIAPSQLKRLWLHQANINMNRLIATKVLGREPTPAEAPNVLEEFGNTSSAGCRRVSATRRGLSTAL